MKVKREHIRVFEHQSVFLNQEFQDEKGEIVIFDEAKLDAFVRFFGTGQAYFSLLRNGVQFNEYVGAIQIGNTLVSVLPKADKRKQFQEEAKRQWNQVLIDMLRLVHGFEVKTPSSSNLSTRNNSVLDLYFELFISEVEYLVHRGLVKKYRKRTSNVNALKGSLHFSKHISKNLVHRERFYTRHSTYDTEHLLHIIIYQCILILQSINSNTKLLGRINSLLLNFPEMPFKRIVESDFDSIVLNRKTIGYRKAIEIARLIILRYHPDLSKGRNNVLALMFDMNVLWEKFVAVSLRKTTSFKVSEQQRMYFWKPENGKRRSIRPDISIKTEVGNFILDTKWKLVSNKPSMEDIRQMFTYHHYFQAKKVALLYPGSSQYTKGNFVDIENQKNLSEMECGLLFSRHSTSVLEWQRQIGLDVTHWINGQA